MNWLPLREKGLGNSFFLKGYIADLGKIVEFSLLDNEIKFRRYVMSEVVPTISIIVIGINIVLAFAIPVVLYLVFRRKLRCDHVVFWVGCAVFIVFAGILEQLLHSVMLNSSTGSAIQKSVWLTAVYGGLMAGLFEESGRYIAFRTILKKKLGNDDNALMYGAGHGGIEVVLVLGVTMINNLVYSIALNTGNAPMILSGLDSQRQATMETVFLQLSSVSPFLYFMSLLERIAALALHISLSVVVWFAAKEKKSRYLFFVAIVLHLCVDMMAVVLDSSDLPILLSELLIWIMVGLCSLFAVHIWRTKKNVYENTSVG